MDSPTRTRSSKAILVNGAVKPWHVIFIYAVCYSVGEVGGYYLTKSEDPAIRYELWNLMIHTIGATILLTYTIVVPEFRRSLPTLFSAGIERMSLRDFALAGGLILCWSYGVYRIAICFPILLARPDAYKALHFTEAVPAWQAKYLLMYLGTVTAAPIGEELLFRGYLMNLWIARWGAWAGIVLSSIVFGLFHWERAVFAAVGGIIFALVYLKYDSLWPGILLHAVFNLLAMPWLIGGLFYVKQRATIGQFSSWIPEFVIGLVFFPIAFLFWKSFRPPRLS